MADTTDTPAIELRNIVKSFDDVAVLDGVSITLERGQTIIVSGVSGSGKSILMHIAVGLIPPDEGEVLVDGRHFETMSEKELLEVRSSTLGIVFQESALFTGMSVYDNTAFRLVEHGWSEEATESAVREILEFVGLQDDMEKLPEELSIGMGRRLEIARALVGWPSIMLFDEATSGLDPINAKQVMNLVIRARDVHGISSFYVTKEMHEIAYLAGHRSVTRDDGSLEVEEGEPSGAHPMLVCVLEAGRVAFLGTVAEFHASHDHAVTNLTEPDRSLPVIDISELR